NILSCARNCARSVAAKDRRRPRALHSTRGECPDQECGDASLRQGWFAVRHRMSGDPARRPRCLKIEAASQSVQIEEFTGEIETGRDTAFHRFEIDLAQT